MVIYNDRSDAVSKEILLMHDRRKSMFGFESRVFIKTDYLSLLYDQKFESLFSCFNTFPESIDGLSNQKIFDIWIAWIVWKSFYKLTLLALYPGPRAPIHSRPSSISIFLNVQYSDSAIRVTGIFRLKADKR